MKTIKLSREEKSIVTKNVNEESKKVLKMVKDDVKNINKNIFKIMKDIAIYAKESTVFAGMLNDVLNAQGTDIEHINVNNITCLLKGYQPIDEENGIFTPCVLDKDGSVKKLFTTTEIINAIGKEYKRLRKIEASATLLAAKTSETESK